MLRPNDPTSGHDSGETTDWPVSGATPAERQANSSAPAPSPGPSGDEEATQQIGQFTRPPQQQPAAPQPPAGGWDVHEQSTQEAPQFTRPPVQHPPAGSSGWPQTPAAYPAQNQPPAGMAGPPYGAPAGGYSPPPNQGYPPTLPPKPRRTSAMNDRRWWAAGGAVVLVAALGGVAFMVNDGGTDATTASPTTSATGAQVPAAPVTTMQPKPSPPAAPPPAPAPPAPTLAADALPGLLLPPDQISQRLNTPGMVPTAVLSNPIPGGVTPANCVTTFVPVAADALNGSGFTGVAVQGVALEPAVKAVQGVVAFPDPGAAKAFFDQRSAEWSACKSSHITYDDKQDAKINQIDLGVPAMSGDVMTLEFTSTNSNTANQRCERALTVRGNVVVDTRACAPNVNSAAYDFASDIAAKIK